jgi:hypothetical protein
MKRKSATVHLQEEANFIRKRHDPSAKTVEMVGEYEEK